MDIDIFETIEQLVLDITTLEGPMLLVAFCVVLGYVVKLIPHINNAWIPVINFIVGPIVGLFVIHWPSPGQLDPVNYPWPHITIWIQVVIRGIMLVAVAWFLHGIILKRFIDKRLPFLKGNTEFFTKPQVES